MGQFYSYNDASIFHESISGFDVQYFSKPGVPNWDTITPSQSLIIDNARFEKASKVLFFGCGNGVQILFQAAKHPETQMIVSDSNELSLTLLNKSIAQNSLSNLTISFDLSPIPTLYDTIDIAIIDIPKGRKISRRWILEAYHALRSNGILWLVGANDQGIQSIATDAADLFVHQSVIAYKKGCRLLRFTDKKDQTGLASWTTLPGIMPGTWNEFSISYQGQNFKIKSLPGVFAADGLDAGTAFLLDHLEQINHGNILDFGCGCGVIGSMIALNGTGKVDMIDINRYAIASARENIKCLALTKCSALFSDGLKAVLNRKYDFIITNPPFHNGKAVDYSMTHALISQSMDLLNQDGMLRLVANKFIRYDKILIEYFPVVDPPVSNTLYTIWTARKP